MNYTNINTIDHYILNISILILAVCGFLLSGLIIILFIISKSVRKSCEYFLLFLIINYFICNILYFSARIAELFRINLFKWQFPCALLSSGPTILIMQSQLYIFSIFLKRYFYIKFPLKYYIYFNTKTSILIFGIIQITSGFIGLFPIIFRFGNNVVCHGLMYLSNFYRVLALISSTLPFIPSLTLYFLMLKIAKKQADLMKDQMNSTKSLSLSSKAVCLKLITTLILWMIYAKYLIDIMKNFNQITGKKGLVAGNFFFLYICINSLIVIIGNPVIKNIIKNYIHCKGIQVRPNA